MCFWRRTSKRSCMRGSTRSGATYAMRARAWHAMLFSTLSYASDYTHEVSRSLYYHHKRRQDKHACSADECLRPPSCTTNTA